MTASLQNIDMGVGESVQVDFGPVVDTAGSFKDLTGASASWRLAKNPTSTGSDIILTKTSASGITFVNSGSQWTVQLNLVPNDTINCPPSSPARWYHELEVTDQSGNKSITTTGFFMLRPSLNNQP